MADTSRRRFLKNLLGTLAGVTGTVVLASASTPPASAGEPASAPPEKPDDIQKRAEQLANTAGTTEEEVEPCGFLNRGFRNAVGGGFRNGGFRNAGVGGGFRNGGFANGVGGGFRNGAFRNW